MIKIDRTPGELIAWLASQFVGVREMGHNAGPIVERFQRVVDGRAEGEPWCVCFLQYVVREASALAGLNVTLYPTESTQVLWSRTPAQHRIALPEPGCVAVWRSTSRPSHGHAGIVSRVDGADVYTIEGNTGAGDQREGDVVAVKRRIGGQIPGFVLLGYIKAAEKT